ncbi:MAG: 2-amino-4-hydroxy-6-hydroxymethyldihydropteridine diphosphokinase [Pseudomonadota bacterium]
MALLYNIPALQLSTAARPAVKSGRVLIGLGANIPGRFGNPQEAIEEAFRRIAVLSLDPCRCSSIYASSPVGPPNQPVYMNAVCAIDTARGPSALLSALKRIERDAGRGGGRRWGPRPLDLDVLAYKGVVTGWPRGTGVGDVRAILKGQVAAARARLVLPHPQMHRRAFVLRPLADVAPGWRHPVLRRSAAALLANDPEGLVSLRRLSEPHDIRC